MNKCSIHPIALLALSCLHLGAVPASMAPQAAASVAQENPAAPGKTTAPAKPAKPATPAAKANPKPAREAGFLYGVAKAPAKAQGTIRLGAYNLENLFDAVDDPQLSGEYDDIKMQTSEDRCKSLAKAIHDLDADVLALEEVEGEDALRWFRDTYLKDMGYTHLASKEVGYYRGVEQSVLSRFPIKDAQVWTSEDLSPMEKYIPKDSDKRKKEGWGDDPKDQEPLKFQRSPLKVGVELPDGSALTLYVVHHKAGGKATAHHRELEALRVNEMIKEDLTRNPDALLAVLGDFNATPMEKASKMYRDNSFSPLVSAYDFRPEAGQAKAKKPKGQDTAASTSDDSALKNRYITHITNRSIDYILLSPALAKRAVEKSFFVFGTLMPGSDYDYKTDQPPAGYASDHCPIAIDLKVSAAVREKPAPNSATDAAKN